MRVLVLGGTAFLGRHIVEHALARGDDVSTFNRGRTAPGMFAGRARELRGDRGADLDALRSGDWDAALDLSGYVPDEVRASSRLLAERAGHLTFVSSISAYAELATSAIDETAPLASHGDGYGARKAASERAAREAFAPRPCLVVRPGLIVGPGDPTNRFSWWVSRLARGGPVLAPAPPERPVQLIDARDLAAWLLEMASRRVAGVFNAVGAGHTMAALLEACRADADADAELVWVAEDDLLAAGIEPWSQLPLWIPSSAGDMAGFCPRPLAQTARETLAALTCDGEPQPSGRTLRMPGLELAVEQRLISGAR